MMCGAARSQREKDLPDGGPVQWVVADGEPLPRAFDSFLFTPTTAQVVGPNFGKYVLGRSVDR